MAKRTIKALLDDSFTFGFWKETPAITTLALSSLRIALQAWLSTYRAVNHRLHVFTSDDIDAADADFNHGRDYFEAQSEALIHLQHFFELALKDLLRAEHTLFVTRAQEDPVVLHKLLKGESVDEDELAKEYTIDFGETLHHLIGLSKAGRLKRKDLGFVADHQDALRALNRLRNRIWHRGVVVLRYAALDELFGRYLLPAVRSVLALPEYAAFESWKPKTLSCNVDVLAEIETELGKTDWNLRKVAYLKELGRASYANPLHGDPMFRIVDEKLEAEAVGAAEGIADEYELAMCPVCGVESLVPHEDVELDEETGRAQTFVWKVDCKCCTFTLLSEVGDGKPLGVSEHA